ncbi:hypothetical protein U1Q18_018541 [Sarracenia purpurea var. burkii]
MVRNLKETERDPPSCGRQIAVSTSCDGMACGGGRKVSFRRRSRSPELQPASASWFQRGIGAKIPNSGASIGFSARGFQHRPVPSGFPSSPAQPGVFSNDFLGEKKISKGRREEVLGGFQKEDQHLEVKVGAGGPEKKLLASPVERTSRNRKVREISVELQALFFDYTEQTKHGDCICAETLSSTAAAPTSERIPALRSARRRRCRGRKSGISQAENLLGSGQ